MLAYLKSIILFVLALLPFTTVAFASSATVTLCETAKEEIIGGNDGWLFNTYEFSSAFNFTDAVTANLQRFKQAFEDNGITLVTIITPSRPYIYPDEIDPGQSTFDATRARQDYLKLITLLNEAGIIAPDLLTAILEQGKETYAFQRDTHWRSEGAQLAANVIAKSLEETSSYINLDKQDFTSSLVKTEGNPGDVAKRTLELCPELTLPLEEVAFYETQAAEQSLLSAAPKAVLLGTSFSITPKANFHGFLSETLSLDIFNASVIAGGPLNALDLYFTSDSYRGSPPTLVFWEFPSSGIGVMQYDDFYRRIIPTLYGACSSETSLAEASVSLGDKTAKLLDVDANLNINSSDYFIYTELSDTSLTTFNLTLTNEEGTTDTVTIRRTTRVPNNGRFFLELSPKMTTPLVSVNVTSEQPLTGTATTRLCKKM